MIAGGIKRILQMVHLQPRSLHDPKKSESSVDHFEERILEKCSSHAYNFRPNFTLLISIIPVINQSCNGTFKAQHSQTKDKNIVNIFKVVYLFQ